MTNKNYTPEQRNQIETTELAKVVLSLKAMNFDYVKETLYKQDDKAVAGSEDEYYLVFTFANPDTKKVVYLSTSADIDDPKLIAMNSEDVEYNLTELCASRPSDKTIAFASAFLLSDVAQRDWEFDEDAKGYTDAVKKARMKRTKEVLGSISEASIQKEAKRIYNVIMTGTAKKVDINKICDRYEAKHKIVGKPAKKAA